MTSEEIYNYCRKFQQEYLAKHINSIKTEAYINFYDGCLDGYFNINELRIIIKGMEELESLLYLLKNDGKYFYSTSTEPSGCACQACCRLMGWDGPKTKHYIYLIKDGKRRKIFELLEMTEEDKNLVKQKLKEYNIESN